MPPDHARQHQSRVVKLEQQPVDAEQHQDVRNARIGDDRQQAAAPIRLHPHQRRAFGVQRPLLPLNLEGLAVHLLQQVGKIRGDEVGNFDLDRLLGGQAHRFAYRPLGPLCVAAAQLREPSDVRRCVVDRLSAHGIARLGCAFLAPLSVPRLSRFLSCSGLCLSSGLDGSPGPPICTGVAAPRLVAGAMAAMWLAYRI